MRKTIVFVIVAAVGLLLVGIGSGIAAQDAESPGEALYAKKCAMCHGMDGVAKKMGAGSANLNDPEWKKTTSAEEIGKIVAEGKGKMKGLKEKLSADEIKAVATYVMELK